MTKLQLVALIENIPLNIKKQNDACQEIFVANAYSCQVM